jgi:hypothetical protein
MNVYISIDGVLRNFINKFHYQYEQAYIDVDNPSEEFEYAVTEPIENDNLLNHFAFQSKDEFDFFTYVEYPMELFGHATVSYNGVVNDLNKYIWDNTDYNITLIGIDEYGKSKSATLFFLSKNGFIPNSIKFIKSEDIAKEWETVDFWITDNKKIIDLCPEGKDYKLFETKYNQHFTNDKKINKLIEKEEEIPTTENKLLENEKND